RARAVAATPVGSAAVGARAGVSFRNSSSVGAPSEPSHSPSSRSEPCRDEKANSKLPGSSSSGGASRRRWRWTRYPAGSVAVRKRVRSGGVWYSRAIGPRTTSRRSSLPIDASPEAVWKRSRPSSNPPPRTCVGGRRASASATRNTANPAPRSDAARSSAPPRAGAQELDAPAARALARVEKAQAQHARERFRVRSLVLEDDEHAIGAPLMSLLDLPSALLGRDHRLRGEL